MSKRRKKRRHGVRDLEFRPEFGTPRGLVRRRCRGGCVQFRLLYGVPVCIECGSVKKSWRP